MKVVYKYEAPFDNLISVKLPSFAEVLRIDTQLFNPRHPKVMIWARVETESKIVDCKIRIAGTGTGHELEEGVGNYINTFFIDELGLVFHAFMMKY